MNELWLLQPRSSGRFRMVLIYPNSYFIGMSNLGMHAVMRIASEECIIGCERAFVDGFQNGLSIGKPVRTIESASPISSFGVIAFSLSFEGDYANVVWALKSSGITLRASQRKPSEPLVIGGGVALTINPEPLAEAFDAILMGEAEGAMCELLQAIEWFIKTRDRQATLEMLSSIQGVYVPQLMSQPPKPLIADVTRIEPAHSLLITSETEFANTFLIEIARGCRFRCRYCAYGNWFCEARFFSAEQVLGVVRRYKQKFNSVGLVGAVVSAHPDIERIAWAMVEDGLKLSVSSLRADVLPEGLVAAMSSSGSVSMTIAPETGTERLRHAIGKPIKDEDICRAAALAEKYGMRSVKLYFMFGLPDESDQDIVAVGDLVRSLVGRFKKLSFIVSACAFVPKRGTPFAGFRMASSDVLEHRRKLLLNSLKGIERLKVSVESIRTSRLQALLSSGDRRMLAVIERALSYGGSFSAWKRATSEILGCSF